MRKQPDNCYSLTLKQARFSSTLQVRPCACALQDLQLEVAHAVFLAQGLQHTESLYQAEALAGHDRSRWHPFEDVPGTKCNSTVGNQTKSPAGSLPRLGPSTTLAIRTQVLPTGVN